MYCVLWFYKCFLYNSMFCLLFNWWKIYLRIVKLYCNLVRSDLFCYFMVHYIILPFIIWATAEFGSHSYSQRPAAVIWMVHLILLSKVCVLDYFCLCWCSCSDLILLWDDNNQSSLKNHWYKIFFEGSVLEYFG